MDGRAEQAVSTQCRTACCLQTAQRAAWLRTWKSSWDWTLRLGVLGLFGIQQRVPPFLPPPPLTCFHTQTLSKHEPEQRGQLSGGVHGERRERHRRHILNSLLPAACVRRRVHRLKKGWAAQPAQPTSLSFERSQTCVLRVSEARSLSSTRRFRWAEEMVCAPQRRASLGALGRTHSHRRPGSPTAAPAALLCTDWTRYCGW